MLIGGIDQGTTSTKGLLIDRDGVAATLPTRVHEQNLPQPGWVEHSAPELLRNVEACIDAAISAGASAIGLANQGETVIAWNRATGEPLAPSIVWQDQRTAAQVERMRIEGCADEVAARSGLPLDCYFSASKLRWLLDNAPDARALARRGKLGLGTSDSYFLERLTGRYVTDPSTASRTALLNLASCQWDERLGELFGVPVELLPEIVDDKQPIGGVVTASGSAVLCASAVDQVAALYGHGCRQPGDGKVTIGTGAFALVVASEGPPDAMPNGSVPTACWPSRGERVYAADGGVYSAAAAVDWLSRLGMLHGHQELSALDGESAASAGVIFVPALSGLAFPHWDRSATGLFIGLDAATSRETLVKAVLEGVAFRVAEVLDGLGFASRAAVPIDGGLSRSLYFTQFLASICGRPLLVRGDLEVTALGIAQLASAVATGTSAGQYPPLADSGGHVVRPKLDADGAKALRGRFAEAIDRSRGWRQ